VSEANAQLRGLGGGVGGVGGIGGGGVPNIGGGGPGVGGIGGAVPSDIGVPSGNTDRIGTGISIPIENGNPPSLPRSPVNSVTNTLNGAVANTSSTALGAANRLGNGVNPLARNAAPPPSRRSGVPAAGERRYVSNELVVSLPSTLTPQAREALLRRHGLTTLDSHSVALTGATFYRLRIADQRPVSEVIRALEADAGVRTAQPNYRFTLAEQAPVAQAAAGAEALQYAVDKLKLPQAHRLATGGQVLVAVIDSGVDTSHPEIAGNIAGSFDALVSQDAAHAHGTAMAGAIVAHAKLTGVAPSARLLAVRAFGSTPTGAESTTLVLLKAIDWAVAHGARVINMSFAGPTDPEITRALAQARKKGIVLVAAAGNAGAKSPPLFPAADGNVVAVTAIGSDDKLLAVANRGKHIAIAAPGVDILAPAPQATYQLTSGTSIAAAHVSGLVALLLERKPDLRPDAVRKLLLSTATDLGPKGRDDQFGAGLADAHRALLSLTATAGEPGRATTAAAR
jgi:subtilisin family serine protease